VGVNAKGGENSNTRYVEAKYIESDSQLFNYGTNHIWSSRNDADNWQHDGEITIFDAVCTAP